MYFLNMQQLFNPNLTRKEAHVFMHPDLSTTNIKSMENIGVIEIYCSNIFLTLLIVIFDCCNISSKTFYEKF